VNSPLSTCSASNFHTKSAVKTTAVNTTRPDGF
jgi:hypothetical protein